MLVMADVIAMTVGRIMSRICGRCFSHTLFHWQLLAMIFGRCCAMNFVADVIATMIVAKRADVTPCEELMTDVLARWQME